jgi:hypothetical protein
MGSTHVAGAGHLANTSVLRAMILCLKSRLYIGNQLLNAGARSESLNRQRNPQSKGKHALGLRVALVENANKKR